MRRPGSSTPPGSILGAGHDVGQAAPEIVAAPSSQSTSKTTKWTGVARSVAAEGLLTFIRRCKSWKLHRPTSSTAITSPSKTPLESHRRRPHCSSGYALVTSLPLRIGRDRSVGTQRDDRADAVPLRFDHRVLRPRSVRGRQHRLERRDRNTAVCPRAEHGHGVEPGGSRTEPHGGARGAAQESPT